MGRTAEPGISFFPIRCDAPTNKKLRLLIKDHGMAGLGVWVCLLAIGYDGKGYYFDMADQEEMELFADDVCSMPVEHVQQIVESCIKRRLFNQAMARDHQVLTSARMQGNYVHATYERRRKGTAIELREDLLLIDDYEDAAGNISIVPRNNSIIPGSNGAGGNIVPGRNPHSIVYESKEENIGTNVPIPALQAGKEEDFLKECYQTLPKNATSIRDFIRDLRPQFIDPYVALWNLFAKQHSMPQVKEITKGRRQQFAVRIKEKGFDFARLLQKASASDVIHRGSWFCFDWIIKNNNNYTKVLEGNYDNKTTDDKNKNDGGTTQQIRPGTETAAGGIERKIQERAGHE